MKPKQDKHNEKHTEVYYKYYIKKNQKLPEKIHYIRGEINNALISISEARKQCNDIFTVLKIVYLEKISFKKEDKVKIF